MDLLNCGKSMIRDLRQGALCRQFQAVSNRLARRQNWRRRLNLRRDNIRRPYCVLRKLPFAGERPLHSDLDVAVAPLRASFQADEILELEIARLEGFEACIRTENLLLRVFILAIEPIGAAVNFNAANARNERATAAN